MKLPSMLFAALLLVPSGASYAQAEAPPAFAKKMDELKAFQKASQIYFDLAATLSTKDGNIPPQIKEQACRQLQTAYYDELTEKCNELEPRLSLEKFASTACPFNNGPFVPTKIPNMASYRELWIEFRTTHCVALPVMMNN